MGVMDFLKGLFSSSNEDQSAGSINISESGTSEPTQDVPQAPESSEDMSGSDDSSLQE